MKLDNYEWQSEFAISHRAEGRAEGEVKGESKALLLMLEARGVDVPEDVRRRVEGCTDLEQIERWIQRAVSADTAEDLFS
ncbi:hypothetical protein [Actinomadura sp. K4S16]|uniref:hypothetical protein n=1 Tax=Actinomadura sp. K4S16 TaxID=1316147 RepID=UPI0011ED73DE|nr:hypothetical protein [Actinomadura sp. K4S16]